MQDNAIGHGANISGIDYQAWYQSVVTAQFFPAVFILLCVVAYVVAIIKHANQSRYNVALLLGLSLLYSGYIIFTVKKLWAWYLFPGMVLLPLGLFLIPWKKWKYEALALLGLLLILFSFNARNIQANYTEFTSRDTTNAFRDKQTAKAQLDNWLTNYTPRPLTIIKSPYLYFDATIHPNINLIPVTGNLEPVSFAEFKPDVMFIEKGFGFMQPDTVLQTLTSYPVLKAELDFFTELTTTGIELDGNHYYYQLVFETSNAYVYVRQSR